MEDGKFDEALEFHGVKNVLYGAILNALRVGVERKIFVEIIVDFEKKYQLGYQIDIFILFLYLSVFFLLKYLKDVFTY